MRRLVLLAVLMAPFSVWAQDGQRPEWTACATDGDCVVAKGLCNPVAVNASFKTEAETFFAQEKEKTKCPQKFWEAQSAAQVDARCRLERCEIVGK